MVILLFIDLGVNECDRVQVWLGVNEAPQIGCIQLGKLVYFKSGR